MMLRGRPGGGVEPAIPGTQRVRREGLGGKWGAISDDRVGWRGQRGGGVHRGESRTCRRARNKSSPREMRAGPKGEKVPRTWGHGNQEGEVWRVGSSQVSWELGQVRGSVYGWVS